MDFGKLDLKIWNFSFFNSVDNADSTILILEGPLAPRSVLVGTQWTFMGIFNMFAMHISGVKELMVLRCHEGP